VLRPTTIKVEVIDDFKLLIEFDNGEIRVFDASLLFNRKAYLPIMNKNIFRTVKTNDISIEWAGEIDVCPDELYYSSTPLSSLSDICAKRNF
jgi:hypothetical protein